MGDFLNPFDAVTDVRRRLYRVLDTALPAAAVQPRGFTPPLNVVKDGDGYIITVELPGLDREAISVELEDNILTISGERAADIDAAAEVTYRRERPFGAFRRSLALPAGQAHDVSAQLADGVLTVRVQAADAASDTPAKNTGDSVEEGS